VPIKLSETPGAVVNPPPRLGEDTTAVLERMLGVSRDDVARLHRDAVIGVAPPIAAIP
jgi:crotonobetainyl-CoA:carnitine CoA-transferase CaiB-like acyl-CoA transferase